VELEVGEISAESSASIPEGELAVLPLSARMDEDDYGIATLSVPIAELATLGRRMAGEDQPDKERELSAEDLEACGKLLNLMGGAIDESFREGFGGDLRMEPLAWWRTSDPGEETFAEGEHMLGTTTVDVPDGTPVRLTLRFPEQLFKQASGAGVAVAGPVLLVGLADELSAELEPILKAAKISVEIVDPETEGSAQKYDDASVIMLSDDRDDGLELLRSLRCSNSTWKTPLIYCLSQPTHDSVVGVMEHGASHLLKVPISEPDLLRILRATGG
jgi:CheY-like chemotaxis protein